MDLMVRARRPPRQDLLIGAVLAGLGVLEGLVVDEHGVAISLAGVVGGVALVWRRVLPVTTAVLTAAPLAVAAALDQEVDEGLVVVACLLGATFSMALHSARTDCVRGFAAVATLVCASVLLGDHPSADILYVLLLLIVAFVPGRLLRRRMHEVAKLTERAVRAEVAVETAAEAAAAEERIRVARELHDIIGHGVSLMVVHAGAAESHLHEPEIARHSLSAVQEVGRQAVADLARLLGLLRADHEEIGLAPQPGIRELSSLVADAATAEQNVTLDVRGDPTQVPAAMGLTIYRVVQEALTNARRHAPGAAVDVVTAIGVRSVVVTVRDDGGTGPSDHAGAGYGLTGLRERIRMFGGTLEFGEHENGGWFVRSELPLRAAGR